MRRTSDVDRRDHDRPSNTLLAEVLTPAALGVAEFLTVGLGALVDIAPRDGLVAAVIVRAVVTACFVLAGVPSLILLRRRLGAKP